MPVVVALDESLGAHRGRMRECLVAREATITVPNTPVSAEVVDPQRRGELFTTALDATNLIKTGYFVLLLISESSIKDQVSSLSNPSAGPHDFLP
jgi:hypothetical protein